MAKNFNEFSLVSQEVFYFRMVYEQKSINGAARKNNQDPGNISRWISKLERSLKAQLFSRHKTGLHPTPLSDRLYQAILRAQFELNRGISGETQDERPVRLGFARAVAHNHFSSRLVGLIQKLALKPEFYFGPSSDLVERIKGRELDFIIIPYRLKFPGLVTKNIGEENLVLCSSNGIMQKSLLYNPELIAAERLLQSISCERQWALTDYFVTAKLLVENPHFMGVLPEGLLKTYQELKSIERYPIEGKMTAVSWPGSVGMEMIREINKT